MVFAFRLTTPSSSISPPAATSSTAPRPNTDPQSYREKHENNATDDPLDFFRVFGIPFEVTAVLTSRRSIRSVSRSIIGGAAHVSVIGSTLVFDTSPRFVRFSLLARAPFRGRSRPAIVSTFTVWGRAPIARTQSRVALIITRQIRAHHRSKKKRCCDEYYRERVVVQIITRASWWSHHHLSLLKKVQSARVFCCEAQKRCSVVDVSLESLNPKAVHT